MLFHSEYYSTLHQCECENNKEKFIFVWDALMDRDNDESEGFLILIFAFWDGGGKEKVKFKKNWQLPGDYLNWEGVFKGITQENAQFEFEAQINILLSSRKSFWKLWITKNFSITFHNNQKKFFFPFSKNFNIKICDSTRSTVEESKILS